MSSIDLTESDIFKALGDFISGLIDCSVVRGLENGLSTPNTPFIAMTSLFSNRLSTNINGYTDPLTPTGGTKQSLQPTQYVIQVDCYGPDSGNWATILTTMIRDEYATDSFPPNIQPLHADDPKLLSIVDGEQNYEQRWMITVNLQYNPVVSTPMQFFDEAIVQEINRV